MSEELDVPSFPALVTVQLLLRGWGIWCRTWCGCACCGEKNLFVPSLWDLPSFWGKPSSYSIAHYIWRADCRLIVRVKRLGKRNTCVLLLLSNTKNNMKALTQSINSVLCVNWDTIGIKQKFLCIISETWKKTAYQSDTWCDVWCDAWCVTTCIAGWTMLQAKYWRDATTGCCRSSKWWHPYLVPYRREPI